LLRRVSRIVSRECRESVERLSRKVESEEREREDICVKVRRE
jgi:hypothetical protein